MGFKLTSPPLLLLSKVDPRMKYQRDKDEMQGLFGVRWNAKTPCTQSKFAGTRIWTSRISATWDQLSHQKDRNGAGPTQTSPFPRLLCLLQCRSQLNLIISTAMQCNTMQSRVGLPQAIKSIFAAIQQVVSLAIMFLWLPSNYESIASLSSNLSSEVFHKMVMLLTRILSESVEMETLDLEKYLLYLCELEFVFCNVQCNVEVVGGCNFSSNVRWAPQGCAGGFLSLLNTLATSSSPCDASKIFRRKPFCRWGNLLLLSGQMQVYLQNIQLEHIGHEFLLKCILNAKVSKY